METKSVDRFKVVAISLTEKKTNLSSVTSVTAQL